MENVITTAGLVYYVTIIVAATITTIIVLSPINNALNTTGNYKEY